MTTPSPTTIKSNGASSSDAKWSDLLGAYADLGRERDWFAEGAIEGTPVALFIGPEKTGKSWVLHDLAVATVLGTKWLGRFEVRRAGVVVALDAEYGAAEFTRRIARLARAHGRDPRDVLPHIRHLHSTGVWLDPESRSLQGVLRAVAIVKPELVIVDPLRNHLNGSENDGEAVLEALRCADAFRRFGGCPVMIAHHLNKSGGFSGHRALRGRADLVFEGTDEEQPWYGVIGRTLRRADPIANRFTVNIRHDNDDDDTIAKTILSCRFEGEASGRSNLSKSALRVLDVLRADATPLTVRAIRGETKQSNLLAKRALEELRDAGLADEREGKWAVSIPEFNRELLADAKEVRQ